MTIVDKNQENKGEVVAPETEVAAVVNPNEEVAQQ